MVLAPSPGLTGLAMVLAPSPGLTGLAGSLYFHPVPMGV